MPLPFDPEVLSAFAVPGIKAPLGVGALAWRYTVFVPLEEINQDLEVRHLATVSHLEALAATLCQHFNGLSISPALKGWGLRDPRNPHSIEFNKNVPFVIYTSATTSSEKYFEALQRELQRCLEQGLILVERQEVFLVGMATPFTPKEISGSSQDPALQTPKASAIPPPQ